jgi:hypothetical protein
MATIGLVPSIVLALLVVLGRVVVQVDPERGHCQQNTEDVVAGPLMVT